MRYYTTAKWGYVFHGIKWKTPLLGDTYSSREVALDWQEWNEYTMGNATIVIEIFSY